MAKIVIEAAPPTALPRRFLLSSPAWGMLAGGLWLFDGELALASRWSPAALALVHAFTLGVLGNVMFGALLQFLPAAAGVCIAGGARAGFSVHVLLNLGAILLVAGFRSGRPALLLGAAALLPLAFAGLLAMILPGLLRAALARRESATSGPGGRRLHLGLAFAVLAAGVTATLGAAMLPGLAGYRALPLWPWVDLHAGWGLLGWVLGLLVSVGAVVMPMFQGSPAPPRRAQIGLLLLLVSSVTGGSLLHLWWPTASLWRGMAALCVACFALAGLTLQWRSRQRRNHGLQRSWRLGFVLAAWLAAMLATDAQASAVGAVALLAASVLVAGMLLEIVAFLGWIELHRRCPKRTRLPAVQVLLPERAKSGVVALFALTAVGLLIALLSRQPLAARAVGAGVFAAHGVIGWQLLAVGRRARAFLAGQQARSRHAT